MSGEKDELVQKAKLAEQAERWVEMINEKMLFWLMLIAHADLWKMLFG